MSKIQAEYNQYQADGVSFEQAVHLIRGEFNVNHEVILQQLAPDEVFVQYGPEGSGRDAEEYNLLFHAIKTKNRSCLELVLQKMLNIQGPDSFKWANSKGTTALHMAVKEKNIDLVRFLLGENVDPSPRMKRDGWTPLHTAAIRRQTIRIIELLVGFGADVNAAVEGSGWTPLHGAIMEKDKASVEYLIAHGANLNLKASKRDVAKGAKLTPRELAMEVKFEPMSVFDDAPETKSKPARESSSPPKATTEPPTQAPSREPEPPTKTPSKEPEKVEEKKIAYTEAELEAMIQARLESQVEKALSAKMAEIMKMKDGGGEETKAETPQKKEQKSSEEPKEQKSNEDIEVEAAMERMRADEAKERAAKH